jgi:hypothetical protein
MFDQLKADEVRLIYDPARGGFELLFCDRRPTARHFNLFGNIMAAGIMDNLRVTCVDSIWDRGGLLLNALYHKPNKPRDWNLHRSPEIGLNDGLTQSDPVLIRQNSENFEIWFGSAPISQPPTHHDPKILISVWLARERVNLYPEYPSLEKPVVVGIRLGFSTLAAVYPLKILSILTDDFK